MRNLLLALMMIVLSLRISRASEVKNAVVFHQEQFSVDGEKISYFAGFPQGEDSFPILIHISGSYSHSIGPESVSDEKDFLGIAKMGFGVIALERRGVVHGKDIDTEKYHYFNTPVQRLSDHLSFVEFLKENPPKNWNGHILVFGISEGGPIAVKLADKIKAQACITAVGCSEQTFKEFIWKHMNDNFFPARGMVKFKGNIINYLNLVIWLFENFGPNWGVDKWFIYRNHYSFGPNPSYTNGLTLFDSHLIGASLSEVGQFYRDRIITAD